MGNYNITGWSAGGRRPITNGLRAGQFRQMGVPRNVSSNIFINNNFGCMGGAYNAGYFDGCCGNGDDGMSKLEKWMLGLGVGGSLLGCIFGAFGKSKSEGAGDTGNAETKANTDEFAGLKDLYKGKDYNFGKVDGKYCCTIGDTELVGDSIGDLHNKIRDYNASKGSKTPEQQSTATTTTDSAKKAGDGSQVHELAQFTWKGFDVTKLSDSKTSPIVTNAKNDTTLSDAMGANVNAPKTIEVTKNGKTYKFELIDDKNKISSDGYPMYKCTSNGKNLAQNEIQEYYLKPDGEFFQNADTAGFGVALGKKI